MQLVGKVSRPSDGVVVVLDKWDLREGQDKHAFMEQMVHDPAIAKVLVVCERIYQLKPTADRVEWHRDAVNFQGGVRTNGPREIHSYCSRIR